MYAVEMGSGAVIYIPTLIKIGSGIQKLIGGHNGCTDSNVIYVITRLLFFSK
jgi:hypothetical protein